jgi:hypothetical protein
MVGSREMLLKHDPSSWTIGTQKVCAAPDHGMPAYKLARQDQTGITVKNMKTLFGT